jgi:AraC-like DNA-binding protein/cbb3-type cytochrome oxidase subunit 3
MQKIKIVSLFVCLLCCNWIIAQSFKLIPDSLQKYNHDDLRVKVNTEFNQSEIDYKRIYIYAQTNLLKAKKENNTQEIIYCYNALADAVKKIELKLKYSDSAISIANKKMPNKLSYLHYCRGLTFYNENRLKEGLDLLLIANKESDHSSLDLDTRINYAIGIIKKTQGNYQEALLIYKKCVETSKENNPSNYLLYLFGLAELYNRMNQIDQSERYTNIGLNLKNEDPSGEYYYPYFISNKGKNYFKVKKYDKAILELINSSKSFKINNDFSNYAENSFFIGECYRAKNQDERAIIYYKKVDSIFIAKKDIYPLIISAYEHLITYYKKKKDYTKLLYYTDQFIKADRVLDDNYKYITSKITKTYDIQKAVASKQAVIASLNSHKNMSLITIGLLLVGIVFLGYLFYKYNKQKQKELQEQKILFEAYKENQAKIKKEIDIDELIKDLQETNIETITEYNTSIAPIKQKIAEKNTLLNIDQKVVKQILNWLVIFKKEEWFLNTYTIDELAKKFNTNSTYLSRVIRATQGCSYPQYVNTLRIEYIINKLETEKKYAKHSIDALTKDCGYNSEDTFVRAFVSHTKMKPSEFIKQLKNNVL